MLKKIKFEGPNKDHTKIVTTDDDNETNKKTIITSTEYRHIDFTAAMKALLPGVKQIVPLDYTKLEDKIEVTGVALAENEDQGRGCVITLQIMADDFNAPLIINTPFLHEDLGDTGVKSLPWEIVDALEHLITQAEMFLAGQRAQENLPLGEIKEKDIRKVAKDHGINDEVTDDVVKSYENLTTDENGKATFKKPELATTDK